MTTDIFSLLICLTGLGLYVAYVIASWWRYKKDTKKRREQFKKLMSRNWRPFRELSSNIFNWLKDGDEYITFTNDGILVTLRFTSSGTLIEARTAEGQWEILGNRQLVLHAADSITVTLETEIWHGVTTAIFPTGRKFRRKWRRDTVFFTDEDGEHILDCFHKAQIVAIQENAMLLPEITPLIILGLERAIAIEDYTND